MILKMWHQNLWYTAKARLIEKQIALSLFKEDMQTIQNLSVRKLLGLERL